MTRIPLPGDIAARRIPSAPPSSSLSGAGVGGLPKTGAIMFFPPEVFPIPGAQEFDVFTFANSPGAGTITPAALQFQLPQGFVARIAVATAGIDNMTNVTNVVFSLRVNGARAFGPAGGYQLFPGVAARATSSVDTYVMVPAGALVDVAITNIDGAAYTVGFGFSGWMWAQVAGEAWKAGK